MQSCSMLNHPTLETGTVTLLLLIHFYQWPTHCLQQLVDTEKLRWRWDSELVNDSESERFGLFGGETGGREEESVH